MSQTIALKQNTVFKEIAIVLAGSLFMALMAQVRVPLPFTPVPLTLQTLAVFLLGGILGPKRALLSLIAYLIEGTCGLPIFNGGSINPLWFLGPHAGYLWGFVLAAFVVGKLTENREDFFRFLLALLVGEAIILGLGTSWLALFMGWKKAFLVGAAPFFIGATLKMCAGSFILKSYVITRQAFFSR
ncbi:MAG: biotin transporter BioY [Verrucomicrobia bacterium]|nr:biotin transporter BioY [Verrucomicrobiota bacterium]